LINSTGRRIRIIVAEDHQLIRKSLADLIDGHNECNVVAEVCNGCDLVTEYFLIRPDLIVVNIILPDMNGMEAFQEILRNDPKVKALFIANQRDEKLICRIYKIGGMGYIYKKDNSRKVLNSIREIHEGVHCFPHNMEEILAKYSEDTEYTGYEKRELKCILSKREYEVFLLSGEGLTSREIADRLLISIKTVEYHLNSIREKLNLRNRNQLISISSKHALLYKDI